MILQVIYPRPDYVSVDSEGLFAYKRCWLTGSYFWYSSPVSTPSPAKNETKKTYEDDTSNHRTSDSDEQPGR